MGHGELEGLDARAYAGLAAADGRMLVERYVVAVFFCRGGEVGSDHGLVFAVHEHGLFLDPEEALEGVPVIYEHVAGR